ncbi:hypothetical protein [Eisenibacter elegans]|jgi:hypothetical protein|uniref:hypothetical protein n=1 Tax=Eisenibacter elegans TaxID=997 RepID=UPI00041B084D|nr:hypothetical protein [Eisenibacter elegans]
MRVLKTIPTDNFNITLFTWNEKYLLKFEQGDLEQTYKVSAMEVVGEQAIDEVLADEIFLKEVQQRFDAMRESWYQRIY